MSRLPTVGGDDNSWGSILNDFLEVEHNTDGTLKNVARPSDLTGKIDKSTVTAKGDLLAGTGSATLSALNVGTDGQVLLADSAQAAGLRWGTNSSTDANAVHKSDLVYNVKDYGALGNNTGNDATGINAAIAAAQTGGGGIVFFPAGTYRCTSAFSVPSGVPSIQLIGVGSGLNNFASDGARSIIFFPSDLGSGVYAFNAGQAQCVTRIQGLCFEGNGAPALGAQNYQMRGVAFGSNIIMEDVSVMNGFLYGLIPCGNHSRVTNCKSTGNYAGVYYSNAQQSQGEADNSYIGCTFSGNSFASIYVQSGWFLTGDCFFKTHMGFSPYGIYLASGAVSAVNFIINCQFYASAIEEWGNAAIYDASGFGIIADCIFEKAAPTFNATLTYATDGVRVGIINCYELYNCEFDWGDLSYFPAYAPGTSYHFNATHQAYGNRFKMTSSVGYNIVGDSHPLLGPGSTSSVARSNEYIDAWSRTRAYPAKTSSAVTAGQVLEFTTAGFVQTATSGGTTQLAGVALQSAGSGEYVLIVWEGTLIFNNHGSPVVTSDAALANMDSLTPDGVVTNGRVKTATAATQRSIGYALGAAGSAGTATPLFVRIRMPI